MVSSLSSAFLSTLCFSTVSAALLSKGQGPRWSPQYHLSEQDASTAVRRSVRLDVERVDLDMGDWVPEVTFPFFFTNIAIGTPPQPFRVVLDLTFGGFGVRSVDCGQECGRDGWEYNISESSTAQELGLRFGQGHGTEGPLIRDVIHLASVQLPNMTFGAADRFWPSGGFDGFASECSDGVMGLAAPNATSDSYVRRNGYGVASRANFLHELYHSDVLEHNVFSLSLPKTEEAIGRLTFGEAAAPNPDFRIPQSPKQVIPEEKIPEGWAIELSNISLKGHPAPFSLPVNLTTVVLLQSWIGLMVPEEIHAAIMDYFRADDRLTAEWPRFDCDLRASLPDLTITLGGQEVTFGSLNYTIEYYKLGNKECVLDIDNGGSLGVAAIGYGLLRHFDLTFDMGRREMDLTWT